MPVIPYHFRPPWPVFRSRVSPEERRYQVYELAKRRFDTFFPDATPAERDKAFTQIAERLGIAS
jgi:hypothetical protein